MRGGGRVVSCGRFIVVVGGFDALPPRWPRPRTPSQLRVDSESSLFVSIRYNFRMAAMGVVWVGYTLIVRSLMKLQIDLIVK